jgi:hypothetical protein
VVPRTKEQILNHIERQSREDYFPLSMNREVMVYAASVITRNLELLLLSLHLDVTAVARMCLSLHYTCVFGSPKFQDRPEAEAEES